MDESIGKTFWEGSKHANQPESDQQRGSSPQPPLELPFDPEADGTIKLADPHSLTLPNASLWQIIEDRRTLRHYTENPVTLDELTALLWYTQGVKRVTSRPLTLRTVPSAGARHPFETYLLANRVAGLPIGLYRYAAIEHSLLLVDGSADVSQRISKACYDQSQVPASAVTFVWAAESERTTWRYSERGYRYILLDAGHVCQNLYLAAEGLGCGVCAIASYDDDLFNAALGLDGKTRFVVYAASLGRRKLE